MNLLIEPALRGTVDHEFIVELFAAFRPVMVRRMFGGAGLFVDGLMFGLVHDGIVYLKADEGTIPAFKREGQGPFSYATKSGTNTIASYWRMPERLYDDPDELARWAAEAFEIARQKAARKLPGQAKPRARPSAKKSMPVSRKRTKARRRSGEK